MKRLLLLAALVALAAPASASAPRILASQDLYPVWSPDGTKIAFTRIERIGFSTVVYSLAKHRSFDVTTEPYQGLPSWSPDGRRLAVQTPIGILTVGVDTEGVDHLTPEPGKDFSPAWSPDGKRIAYLSTRGNSSGRLDLWTTTPAGAEDTQLARNAIGIPAWSPDSRSIAFQRDDGIYLMSGVEAAEIRVAHMANPGAPTFSHDGTRIAYVAAGRLWVVPASGLSPPTPVTPFFGQGARATWSRDDKRVALAAFSPTSAAIAYSGPRPACPGHHGIRLRGGPTLTGTCVVAGTARADAIEGAPGPDTILAGAGNDVVHANDRSRDVVDCGPGTDRVFADRTDRLRRCEHVSR